MSLRLESMAEFEKLRNRNAKAVPRAEPKSKFGAAMCEADGIKFRSKKERRRYLELMALAHQKEVSFFLRQVPFYLPGGTKYVLDFLVFWSDGGQTYEDVKGMKTPMFIMKKKQVEALYPVKITDPYSRIMYSQVPGVKRRRGVEDL